jgi:hypothetical protein
LRDLAAELQWQWQQRNLLGVLAMLISGRPALSGEPEIDAIILELHSRRPQKF